MSRNCSPRCQMSASPSLFRAANLLSPFHMPIPQETAAELSLTPHNSQSYAQSSSHSNQHVIRCRSLQCTCKTTTYASNVGHTVTILLFRGWSCQNWLLSPWLVLQANPLVPTDSTFDDISGAHLNCSQINISILRWCLSIFPPLLQRETSTSFPIRKS